MITLPIITNYGVSCQFYRTIFLGTFSFRLKNSGKSGGRKKHSENAWEICYHFHKTEGGMTYYNAKKYVSSAVADLEIAFLFYLHFGCLCTFFS